MIKAIYVKLATIAILFSVWSNVFASGFNEPTVKIEHNSIKVSFSFTSDEKFIKSLKEGASKEVLVYADLFRHWDILPDEFITGNKTVVDLYSDPLKGEYIASKYDGKKSIVKRFKSVESMLHWAFEFKDVKVANMKGYEYGSYYVKIKAEAYSDTVVSLLAKMLLIQPKDFSYEIVVLRFKWLKDKILPLQ